VVHPLRFDAYVVVYGSADPLFTAEITFGSLHGYMSASALAKSDPAAFG